MPTIFSTRKLLGIILIGLTVTSCGGGTPVIHLVTVKIQMIEPLMVVVAVVGLLVYVLVETKFYYNQTRIHCPLIQRFPY